MAKLTDKQKRFVEEYLVDLNATQAAIRAGYSVSTAQEQGSQNLSKLMVQQAIAEKMAERSKRTGVNQDRIILELARIGFSKISDVVNLETGEIKEGVSEDDLACIQSIKVKPNEFGVEREVKLYDKKSALADLGKHLGMFRGQSELDQEEQRARIAQLRAQTERIANNRMDETDDGIEVINDAPTQASENI